MTSENGHSQHEESRENIPLKYGRKSRQLCDEDFLSGAKFINVAFATLTAIITAALLLQIYYGDYQVVPHGSVATDSFDCSTIGTAILKNGGNAVDAAIAAVFCLSVATPHLVSLDSVAQVLVYNHRQRTLPDYVRLHSSQLESPLPTLVTGMAYLHRQYGTQSWEALVRPSVNLARKGFLLSKMLVTAVKQAKVEDIYGPLEAGRLLQLDDLASTLQEIAEIPEKTLYEYITSENTPTTTKAQKTSYSNFDIYVPSEDSIGAYFTANLKQLHGYNFTPTDTTKSEYIYRVAQAIQSFYESSNISDHFHQGVSTNVATVDLNDNYVSLSTGLYDFFGSGEMTSKGYIVDRKEKNKACSYFPLIVTDASAICGRRLILGANDISIASQLILDLLVAQNNVSVVVEAPRFHILNNGTDVGIEGFHSPLFDEEVLHALKTLTATNGLVLMQEPYLSSNVVEKTRDDLNSHSDSRGGGIASRF